MAYSSRHMAYTERSFSEFLTPSRRSHPHVEPLLAPLKFLTSKQGVKMFLSLQGMHFPLKTHHPWSLLMPLSFDKSPLLLPVIKPLWLWRNAQKASFFPLFHLFQTPVSTPSYSSLFPPINPLNPPKTPFKFYPYPLSGLIHPFFPLSFPFLTSKLH